VYVLWEGIDFGPHVCKRILKTQQKNYLFHPNMWLINYIRKGP
jgi:hypothetical protein